MKKKKCPKCGKVKNVVGFTNHKNRYDGLSSWCRKCIAINTKRWRLNNKKKVKKYKDKYYKKNVIKIRNDQYKRLYGITTEQYDDILKQQDYGCAICGKTEEKNKRRLGVDHNHKTKFVRGVLCAYCNGRLLQHLRDNKRYAIGLIQYLQNAVNNDTDWSL